MTAAGTTSRGFVGQNCPKIGFDLDPLSCQFAAKMGKSISVIIIYPAQMHQSG
jgi:hypothetical protein